MSSQEGERIYEQSDEESEDDQIEDNQIQEEDEEDDQEIQVQKNMVSQKRGGGGFYRRGPKQKQEKVYKKRQESDGEEDEDEESDEDEEYESEENEYKKRNQTQRKLRGRQTKGESDSNEDSSEQEDDEDDEEENDEDEEENEDSEDSDRNQENSKNLENSKNGGNSTEEQVVHESKFEQFEEGEKKGADQEIIVRRRGRERKTHTSYLESQEYMRGKRQSIPSQKMQQKNSHQPAKQEKKRNEFWKFRHNPNNKKEKIKMAQQQQQNTNNFSNYQNNNQTNNNNTENYVEREVFHSTFVPNKINFENEEEFITASIISAQKFNENLQNTKNQLKQIIKAKNLENQNRKNLEINNMPFSPDIPLTIFDQIGNQYYFENQHFAPKEVKSTVETFIYQNVLHENNKIYLNEINKNPGYISRNILNQRRKRRRKKQKIDDDSLEP